MDSCLFGIDKLAICYTEHIVYELFEHLAHSLVLDKTSGIEVNPSGLTLGKTGIG